MDFPVLLGVASLAVVGILAMWIDYLLEPCMLERHFKQAFGTAAENISRSCVQSAIDKRLASVAQEISQARIMLAIVRVEDVKTRRLRGMEVIKWEVEFGKLRGLAQRFGYATEDPGTYLNQLFWMEPRVA